MVRSAKKTRRAVWVLLLALLFVCSNQQLPAQIGGPPGPSVPGDPTDPADPGDPTDPADPGDPADPADPGDPVGEAELNWGAFGSNTAVTWSPPETVTINERQRLVMNFALDIFSTLPGASTAPYTLEFSGFPVGVSENSFGAPSSKGVAGWIPEGASNASPYEASIQILDSSTPPKFTEKKTFLIEVGVAPPISILSKTPALAVEGEVYEYVLSADGGAGNDFNWCPSDNCDDQLPPGLKFEMIFDSPPGDADFNDPADEWAIIGTPEPGASANSPYKVTLTAEDEGTPSATATLEVEIVVIEAAVSIETLELPSAVVGIEYGPVFLSATNGTAPYTFDATALPAGLTLQSQGESWFIAGVPSEGSQGEYSVNISVIDSTQPASEDSETFALVVSPRLTFAEFEPAVAIAGIPYPLLEIFTTSGLAPYEWEVIGSIPEGLVLNDTTGASAMISGVPLANAVQEEAHQFNLRISDSSPDPKVGIVEVSITVEALPLVMTTGLLPTAKIGTQYDTVLLATGGVEPYTWTTEGLPLGISLVQDADLDTWRLTGDLGSNSIGNYLIKLQVAESSFKKSVETVFLSLSVVVQTNQALSIKTSALPVATIGEPYPSFPLQADGGSGSYVWEQGIGLPEGLSITTDDGGNSFLSGTPIGGSIGNSLVQLVVRDQADLSQSVSAILPLVLKPSQESVESINLLQGESLSNALLSTEATAGCALTFSKNYTLFVVLFALFFWTYAKRFLSAHQSEETSCTSSKKPSSTAL